MFKFSRQWINNQEFMEALCQYKDSFVFFLPEHKLNFDHIVNSIDNEFKEVHSLLRIALIQHCELEDGVIKKDEQGPFFKSDKSRDKFDEEMKGFMGGIVDIIADPLDLDTIDLANPLSPRDVEALAPILKQNTEEDDTLAA